MQSSLGDFPAENPLSVFVSSEPRKCDQFSSAEKIVRVSSGLKALWFREGSRSPSCCSTNTVMLFIPHLTLAALLSLVPLKSQAQVFMGCSLLIFSFSWEPPSLVFWNSTKEVSGLESSVASGARWEEKREVRIR